MQKRLRREVLGTLSVAAGFMLAGCSSDGGDSDDTGDNGASLDLNLTVGELPDAFESLRVEFSGFSLFTETQGESPAVHGCLSPTSHRLIFNSALDKSQDDGGISC